MDALILGAGGQLGADLTRLLGDRAAALARADADLARPDSIRDAIAKHRPRVVYNCAAFNFVDRAEREPEAAFAINALGVHHLAIACREADATLVHFSTDYVFGGDPTRTTPIDESVAPAPTCVYGVSKLTGEYLARLVPKHFVIRTCGVFGLAGRATQKGNFVEMIVRQIEQGKPLRVVTDQRCTPTFSADLAAAAIQLVETGRHGLHHVTNAGDCTWHEFAEEIVKLLGRDLPIQRMTTADFGSPARRPSYSVLDCSALAKLGLPAMRPWREALADYLRQRSGAKS